MTHTLVNIPNSRQQRSKTSAKFSPEWGPYSIQKSNNISFSCQSLVIQWAVMPRKGNIFEEVHASSVKDKRPGAFWLTNKILKIKILIIIQKIYTCKTWRILFRSMEKVSIISVLMVSAMGGMASWLSRRRTLRRSLFSTSVNDWSEQTIHLTRYLRKQADV